MGKISDNEKIFIGLAFIFLTLMIITILMAVKYEDLDIAYKKLEQKNEKLSNHISFLEKTLENINTQKEVNYMWGTATAYTPSEGGINSDSDPEVTATMTPAKNGVIAVNPRVIPYGSEVMIIHNNTVVRGRAEDTGGAMRKNPKQVDILMEDITDAVNWGRKEVHIIWW